VPLVIALPFIIATVFTIPALIAQERKKTQVQEREDRQDISHYAPKPTSTRLTLLAAIQAGLLVVMAIYFFLQGVA
jgi:hypothetical protein